MIEALSVFALDFIQLLPLECVTELRLGRRTDFHGTLIFSTGYPIAVLLIGLLVHWLLRLTAGTKTDAAKAASLRLKADRIMTYVFFLFYIVLPSTSAKIFSIFQCFKLDDPEQTRVLRADFSVDCRTGKHLFVQIYAIVMMVIYPFGVSSSALFTRHLLVAFSHAVLVWPCRHL